MEIVSAEMSYQRWAPDTLTLRGAAPDPSDGDREPARSLRGHTVMAAVAGDTESQQDM